MGIREETPTGGWLHNSQPQLEQYILHITCKETNQEINNKLIDWLIDQLIKIKTPSESFP